jgi:hypothetical protein
MTSRLKGADGVSREPGAIQKDMKLGAYGFWFRGPLSIEEGVPSRIREDQDVVGRRLWRVARGLLRRDEFGMGQA